MGPVLQDLALGPDGASLAKQIQDRGQGSAGSSAERAEEERSGGKRREEWPNGVVAWQSGGVPEGDPLRGRRTAGGWERRIGPGDRAYGGRERPPTNG